MDAMQLALVDACRPNVNYIDLHLLAHRKVAEILLRFGFVRDSTRTAIVETRHQLHVPPPRRRPLPRPAGPRRRRLHGRPHAASTIPKPEGHPYLRLTRVVEPGMVFTIEPGLYFIESLLGDLQKSENAKYVDWTKVDAFRKYGGIRIEDDILDHRDGQREPDAARVRRVS